MQQLTQLLHVTDCHMLYVSIAAEMVKPRVNKGVKVSLTCLVGIGAGKEHAEAVLLVPVPSHAFLKDISLHHVVRQGGIAADGQGYGPLGLPLLAWPPSWAQQQPGHWASGLLARQHCLLIFWQSLYQAPIYMQPL